MKLMDLFTADKQITDTTNKNQTNSVQNSVLINRQIHSLVPGQTIQGELVARNGSEVQVKLADDVIIKARLEQNMNLEVGKMVTFEVKNNGHSLYLSPLYTNVATDANILKALDMASLPITQKSIEMTEMMMRAGLSIDRNSLQQVFRESNLFTNADIADIVDLHKLSMSVNEGNLSQLAAYKNLNHQLVNGLNHCMDTLPDTMQNLLQSGDIAGAEKLFQELLNMIQTGGTADTAQSADGVGQTGADMMQTPLQNPALVQTADGQLLVLPFGGDGQVFTFSGDAQLLQTLLQALSDGDEGLLQALSDGDEGLLQALAQAGGADSNPETGQLSWNQNINTLNATLGSDNSMVQLLMQGEHRQVLHSMLQQDNGQSLLQLLAQNTGDRGQGVQSLSDYLKGNLQGMWTITPEEVADAKQVEQLYQRLDRQVKGLMHALESVNQTGTEAYRATVSLSQNLDFMQQLNQAYTFVQLPLRLQQGENAHGELFVYTNKKHLAAKAGQISALLHLDMKHLGPLDVYVAMQNEKVNTKFYVQDEEMLDFLGAHMDILTERLKARGYHYQCEMVTREAGEEKTQSSIQQILKANGHVPMVHYAFDVRT